MSAKVSSFDRLMNFNLLKTKNAVVSMNKDDIIEAVKKLPSNEESISNDIPVSIIKNFTNCYCEKLANIFNDCLKENKFPNFMIPNFIAK